MNRTSFAAALFTLFALCACGASEHATRPLRLAINNEPHSLVTFAAQSIQDNEIDRLFAEPLIGCDAQGRPVPVLAEEVPTLRNGGISADGLTITYRLRNGVRWHDGVPFTSADVRASFRAVMDPRNIVATRHGYDTVARLETPDARTVRFRLKRRFAPFVGTVFAESDSPYYLAPAHLLAGAGVEHSALATRPVGTGPYRVVRWKRNDRIVLSANPDYWGGAPRIARVEIRFIPAENSQLVALRTGEIDGVIGMSTNAARSAAAIAGIHIVHGSRNGYYGVVIDTAKPALRDVRVRRALAVAMDAARFRAVVTHGMYRAAAADLPRGLWAVDATLQPAPFDPSAARALLAAAGYGATHRLALELAYLLSSETHKTEALALQAELAAVGVDLRLHGYTGSVYSAPAQEGGVLAGGRYDLALYGWYSGMDPDDSTQFTCAERPPAGYDIAFYCNAAMDAAQRAALSTYDPAARRRAYAAIERLVLRDVPLIVLASPVSTDALRAGVSGFAPSLVTDTVNAQRWDATFLQR